MDFLDSIEIETDGKKSRRVRSWYMHEQFRSLERNQLDAARKLKSRSHQDKILRQELSERRARRKLYDQFGLCHSESCIDNKNINKGSKTYESTSADEFFETYETHDDDKLDRGIHSDTDVGSQDDSVEVDMFKSLEDIKDDESYAESVNSVVRNKDFTTSPAVGINPNNNSIADEINLQLETVKKNIKCLEKYSMLCSGDSTESFGEDSLKSTSGGEENNANTDTIWSKLVSFAYQVIQLNHGNCYYDYSSQLLTAVLACDVLRKGVNSMCHILQPYVSPIKFATDDSDASSTAYKNTRRKKTLRLKKLKKPFQRISQNRQRNKKKESRNTSEEYWRDLSIHSFGYMETVRKKFSDLRHSVAKFSTCESELSKKSSSTIWPSISSSSCECSCHAKVKNPMLKIGQYIDKILVEGKDGQRV